MNSRLIWLWALLVLLTLGGCGGGKKTATFSVNGTASVIDGGFDDVTEFAITGAGLRNALIVPSSGCADDLEEIARVDNTVRLTCTTTNVEVRFTVIDAKSGEAFVVTAAIDRPNVPYTISAITPGTSAKLGAASEFTVTGTNLYVGVVRIDAEGCGNVTTTVASDDDIPRISKISCVLISATPKFKVIGLDTDQQIGNDFAVDPATIGALDVVPLKATASGTSQDGVDNTFTVTGYFNEASNVTVTSSECTDIKNVAFNASAARLLFTCKPNGLGTKFQILVDNVAPQVDTLLVQLPMPIRIAFGFALGSSTNLDYRIDVDLDYTNAPNTVTNFLKYVDQIQDSEVTSYFVDTLIHRIEKSPGFSLIQGGAFTSKETINNTVKTIVAADPTLSFPRAPIPLEASAVNNLSHTKGTIAMARTNDPDSATSQFFFNVTDNSAALAPSINSDGYAVFGSVVETDGSQTALENIFNRPLTPLLDENNEPVLDNEGSPVMTPVPLENIRILNVIRVM